MPVCQDLILIEFFYRIRTHSTLTTYRRIVRIFPLETIFVQLYALRIVLYQNKRTVLIICSWILQLINSRVLKKIL